MIRTFLSALIGGFPVILGRVQYIAAPGRWVVKREDGRLRIEVKR